VGLEELLLRSVTFGTVAAQALDRSPINNLRRLDLHRSPLDDDGRRLLTGPALINPEEPYLSSRNLSAESAGALNGKDC